MTFWHWLRDFADRRMGHGEAPEREAPKATHPGTKPPPIPPIPPIPPLPSFEDLLGGWAPFFTQQTTKTTSYAVTKVTCTCATCGQKNRIDMAKPGQVRCGKCGLPLRVTVKVSP